MAELALVTGGTRGIGHEVCRQLLDRGWDVWFTARAPEAAAAAVEGLGGRGRALLADVADPAGRAALADEVARSGRTLRALVHNAGVALDGFDASVVRRTMAVNLVAPMRLTELLLPHLGPGSRVVVVSSGSGALDGLPAGARARLSGSDLDPDGLEALVERFAVDVEQGRHAAEGWPSSAYKVSKAAVNAWVRWAAPRLAARGTSVSAVCPGWVRTDMGGTSAPRSVEQGAAGIAWAATRTDAGTGDFSRDERPIPW